MHSRENEKMGHERHGVAGMEELKGDAEVMMQEQQIHLYVT